MSRALVVPRRRTLLLLVLVSLVLTGAGCGADSSAGGGRPRLVVSAAASLQAAFTQYGRQFDAATTRFSFAGSDVLAAQIRAGLKPDVYAAANTTLPDGLYTDGFLAGPTVTFASNELVIAVPAKSTRIRHIGDLARPGVRIAVGTDAVPVGSYTDKVLLNLSPGLRYAILANVRSREPDVTGIVGKLTQGAVDAGFLYITDVRATNGRLRAIHLPARLTPVVQYGIGILKAAKHPEQAKAFIYDLLTGAGRDALRRAGFGPPPAAR